MLRNNKITFLAQLALFVSLVMEAHDGIVEKVIFKYEDFHASSYAPTIKEITYNYDGCAYVIEEKENLSDIADVPSYIDKNVVCNFIDTLTIHKKDRNTILFTKQEVDRCLLYVNSGNHTDIPMILSSYNMDDMFLKKNVSILCSMDSSDMHTLMESFHKNTRKPFWSISLRFQDRASVDIQPNSVYEGDNWSMSENSYVNYEFVANFLSQSHVSNLFVPLEKEYMMIHLMGIYKRVAGTGPVAR